MAGINPFQQPLNYAVDVQSPFEAALGGFKIGANIAEVQAKQAEAERKQKFTTGLQAFFANPNRKYEDLEPVLAFADKQQFDALQAIGKNMGERKLDSSKAFFGQLLVANEYDPAKAQTMLETRIEAEQDPNQKEAFKSVLETMKVSPKKSGEMIEFLGGATFGKDWYDGITKVREERRTQQEFGPKLAKAESEAEQERIKAKYAEDVALKDLEKKAADLGLTKAQTNQALATTRKLGAEIAKTTLELEALKATGGMDPEKTFAQEEKIRKEWQGRSKVYNELQGTFNTLEASASSANGPGDIALITGFMKMLDPGSVVRETEFATARDTGGLFTQLQNRLEKAKNGQLLSPQQRKEYVALSRQYLNAAQKKADQEKKDLGIVVKNYRLNPENVFGAERAPADVPVQLTLPNGQVATFPNQKAADDFKAKAGL